MPGIPAATAAFAAAVSFAATGDAAHVWAVPPESASATIGSSVRMRRDIFMLSTVPGLNPGEKAANSTPTVRLTALRAKDSPPSAHAPHTEQASPANRAGADNVLARHP